MWSIGCIFAEFFGKKGILPGQSGKRNVKKMNDVKILGFEQLQFILQKIGTPMMKSLIEFQVKRYCHIC